MIKGSAFVFTNGWLNNLHAKTCHGLLRGTDRFDIICVIDSEFAGQDAGQVLDGKHRNVPVFATIEDAIEKTGKAADYAVVGVAVHGGVLPQELRKELFTAIKHKMSVVCGLHSFVSEDPEFIALAKEHGVILHDVRKPRPTSELQFWEGDIYSIKASPIAVLGTDCALGKRTTTKFLTDACNKNGVKAEMIYTGQTGWMQGSKYGFIFDSTINDFISGEIERVLVQCDKEAKPDVMFIEGQSALRNPSGPCGSEFLLSGNAKGVILQHAPGRTFFEGYEHLEALLPTLEQEIAMIEMYGSRVLAITLNEENWSNAELESFRKNMMEKLKIPIVRPLKEGVDELVPIIKDFINAKK